MMKPTFSIIIPAHNEEKYLRKTLHSVKQQSYQNFETIVVANGCTDKTEEIVKKRSNVRVLSLPKANVSVARNAGALNANGEVLVFLDADTKLQNDSLSKIKEEFNDKISVATTTVKPDIQKMKYNLAMKLKNFYNHTGIYKGCSGVLICRKKEFHKVEGYNPEINVREHRKLILKLANQGKYKCINTTVVNSMRRFEKWGLKKATMFWATQWYQDNFGEMQKTEYENVR